MMHGALIIKVMPRLEESAVQFHSEPRALFV
jgi:hypothetical protein